MDLPIQDIISSIGGVITTILTPMLGILLYRDIKRRREEALTRKTEEEGKQAEADTIKSYAEEWKELYEKKETLVDKLNEKIDTLYTEIAAHRSTENELRDEIHKLNMRLQEMEITKCQRRGCRDRIPPSEY